MKNSFYVVNVYLFFGVSSKFQPSKQITVNNKLSRKPSNELETSYCIDGHDTNDELQVATGFKQYSANVGKNFASVFQETSQANYFLDYLGSRPILSLTLNL